MATSKPRVRIAADGSSARFVDGLANVMSGAGTSADKRMHSFYSHLATDPAQVQAAYRNSWLMRKIVDAPASDMTRERRDWQADKEQIAKLEAVEKRLDIWAKLERALKLGALGGGAIIIGDGAGDPSQPLPEKPSGLRYLHVVSRWRLRIGEIETDPESPWFDEPRYFTLYGTGHGVNIHPSRVIPFKGKPVLDETWAFAEDRYWGDPVYRTVIDAVKNADMAQNGFASLIDEAQYDVIGIPDMMSNLATPGYEAKLMARLALARAGKSVHRSLVRDAAETWETREVSWAGIPDTMRAFLEVVAGASDIPATRLLGTSPKGLNATGEGDEANYVTMISTRQENELRPALDRLDPFIMAEANVAESDIWYDFPPLVEMTEAEKAELNKKKADTVKTYIDAGINADAMLKAAENMIVEDGWLPGFEQAIEDFPTETGMHDDPEGNKPGEDDDPSRLAANDAEPRSLYVRRDVLNWKEIERWAKDQGFKTTVGAKMHVTIVFSRTPVDWMKMGRGWDEDKNGRLTVAAGGPRLVEPLGDGGAVVLLFSSTDLQWRHRQMIEEGATSDYDDYQPHVTISWEAGDVDLKTIEPYTGKIELGPEVFEEVKEDWKSTITEDGGKGA